MREILEERLYDFVCVYGEISTFGSYLFDGHDTIVKENPKTGLINPIRATDNGPRSPIYFVTGTTLIVNATLDGEIIGDGHLWIPEDLSMKDFSIGDKVNIYGNVEMYRKKENEYDYCIHVKRVEHFNNE